MPTTFANTINGNEILAKRSQCDYAGNDIQTTYAAKSELPTATSDLTNDSNFITSADVPVKDVQVGGESVVNAQGVAEISIPQTGVLDVEVDGSSVVNAQGVAEISMPTFTQVNADWDASSGVQEILHKPDLSIYAESSDLATVATSGSYNDLLEKPSIPAAQINADWDATSGVSEILNKPQFSTVAMTGDYFDLQNLPSIPAAQVNSDWNSSSGVSEILNKPTIPSGTQLVPAATSADADKVLTVNAQGTPAWATAQAPISAGDGISITNNVVSAKVDRTTIDTNASGELTVIGGGGGDGADWDAEQGEPGYIENKPVPKTLTAGTGISITENASTITISSSVTAPVRDVTVDGTSVVSNGVAAITSPTVDQTYDASSTNAQSGVAVASGISSAIGDLPTNLTSAQILALKQALGVDETVLWEGTMIVPTDGSNLNATITLSESIANFDRIGIYLESNVFAGYFEITAAARKTKCIVDEGPNSTAYIGYYLHCVTDTTLTYQCGFKHQFIGAYVGQYWGYGKVVKVVGIHRIASN